MIIVSIGVEPSFQSTYMPCGSPFTNTTRNGRTLPDWMASSKNFASGAMPCWPPPDPCSQYRTGKRACFSCS